jgi:hypothetical protein
MIELLIVMIGVVLDVTGMMRLEMAMDDLGMLAALGFSDVNVLLRQQREAEQTKHGGDGDRAPQRHCGELSVATDEGVNSVEILTMASGNRQGRASLQY